MRSYVTLVDGRMDLLPFFARHYVRNLGVTEFYLLTFGTKQHQANAKEIIEKEGGKVIFGLLRPANTFLGDAPRDTHIRKNHPKGEWAFFTDMDEFPRIDTQQAIKAAEEHNESYVAGRWYDRIGASGRLRRLQQDERLVDQYPMGCRTREYLGANQDAFILSKFAPFNHHPSSTPKIIKWPPHKIYTLFHFKWNHQTIKRLQVRRKRCIIKAKRRGRANPPWVNTIARTLEMLQRHNGIPKKLLTPIKHDIDV